MINQRYLAAIFFKMCLTSRSICLSQIGNSETELNLLNTKENETKRKSVDLKALDDEMRA